MGAHVLVERSNARLTNATLRARRGVGLLRDAFGDAGAAILELHGRVQRRLKCRPTLERACVGRSKQGTGGAAGWTRTLLAVAHLLAP